jgi:histidyl-tRNA synthetase
MYSFEDRSGRALTLRPEGTAGVMRAYLEHGLHRLPQPIKVWYELPMFRYNAVQKGRYREHYQFGAEAVATTGWPSSWVARIRPGWGSERGSSGWC